MAVAQKSVTAFSILQEEGVHMKKYDYLIVGAGLFGAVFAHGPQDGGKHAL